MGQRLRDRECEFASNFKHGTAGRRLCERCKKLNREGK